MCAIVRTAHRAVRGVLEATLAPGRAGLIDRGAGVTVRMLSGQLQSVDDAALLAGANLCAIGDGTPAGWELIQFRDAVLVGPDTYILSHRLRGQLGTESAGAQTWPEGSFVVMMDGTPGQIDMPDAMRRRAQHYRIGPAGRPVDDPAYRHAVIAFDGAGLRPFSPAHLRAAADTDGTLHVGWIRRTRIDGDRWDTPDVPLGEESESYLLRIFKDGEILREETMTAPSWTYPAAQRTADGATLPLDVQVAQISARFGAGVFATAQVIA